MAEISIVWDQRTLQAWRERLPEKAIAKALQRAGSDAIRTMRTEATRYVRAKKRLKVKALQDGLVLKFTRNGAQIPDMEWEMGVSGKTVRVIDYPGAQQTKAGVSVAINAGKRTLIASAFIAEMRSGHLGVFLRALGGSGLRPTRQGKLRKGVRQPGARQRVARLKIEEAFTTKISEVFNDKGMIPFVQALALHKFAATFERNCRAELNKLTPKG